MAPKVVVTLFALLALSSREATARSCVDDTIRSKFADGEILIMASGAVYNILPGDNIDSALWLPTENVIICEAPMRYQGRVVMIYDIINSDSQGEKVCAQRLR